MSEPPVHTASLLFHDWNGEAAPSALNPSINPPANYQEPLAAELFPIDMDIGAFDWEEIMNGIDPNVDFPPLPPITTNASQPNLLPSPPRAAPSILPDALINAASDASNSASSDMLINTPAGAPMARSTPQNRVDLQPDVMPGSGPANDNSSSNEPAADMSNGAHTPEHRADTLSGASYTLNDYEAGEEHSDDDANVGSVRTRLKPPAHERARRKVTTAVNRERKEAADEEAVEIRARRDKEKAEFNEKYCFAPDYTHPSFNEGKMVKSSRVPSASNALNSKASTYFNQGRAPGERFNMPQVMALMKLDPEWCTRASEMEQGEQNELRSFLVKKREQENMAARPTRLASSKTADSLLKKINEDLHRLQDQTGCLYFMMSTKKDHDSAVRAGLMGSEGLYDFFMDMYKLNPFDVAKDLQVYALQKKRDNISGKSIDSLRKLLVKLIQSSMSMILQPGHQIPMSYKNFQVDIVEKFYIKIIGWPEGIPFIKPADIGNIEHLRKLIKAFKTGDAYWRPLNKGEKKKTDDGAKARREAGIPAKDTRKRRSDYGGTHNKPDKRKAADTSNKENGPTPKRARITSRELIASDEEDHEDEDAGEADDGGEVGEVGEGGEGNEGGEDEISDGED
ncbi:hypothetical protein HWV62_40838 [Athelia sp. TMB]|nr:hypothetical protein HWV62_40838 [Athelia sp. TMB]